MGRICVAKFLWSGRQTAICVLVTPQKFVHPLSFRRAHASRELASMGVTNAATHAWKGLLH